MTEDEIVELFMNGVISAAEMVDRLSRLNRSHSKQEEPENPPLPARLVRAQAAIRRISSR